MSFDPLCFPSSPLWWHCISIPSLSCPLLLSSFLRHCVSLVLPSLCSSCRSAPSPSIGFPMLWPSYLSHAHVWSPGSAALCKLFRNAWIPSVLLCSFHHYSLPGQQRCTTTRSRFNRIELNIAMLQNVTQDGLLPTAIIQIYTITVLGQRKIIVHVS